MRKNIRHFFELLWSMTEKELRARYKYTVFGFIWLVANPVLQMIIIGFVFTYFMKSPIEYYYFHLFIGLLVWNFFSLSLAKATPSIVYERALIKKAAFPRAIIPLSIIFSNAIHFIIAFMLFLIPVGYIGTLSPYSFVYLSAAIILLCTLIVGFSLLSAALNVRYRDINFFVQALLIIWFYATPIIYSLTQIPNNLLWLWRINPPTSVVQLFQFAIINAPPPGPAMLFSNICVSILLLILGIRTFSRESENFDDWL